MPVGETLQRLQEGFGNGHHESPSRAFKDLTGTSPREWLQGQVEART